MSTQAFDPPSYWYNLTNNDDGSLCKLLLFKERIFKFILIKCGIIRQKVVRGNITTIILNDQWNLFIIEYELLNIEINKVKIDVLVENKLFRRGVSFIRIDNKHYSSSLKASK